MAVPFPAQGAAAVFNAACLAKLSAAVPLQVAAGNAVPQPTSRHGVCLLQVRHLAVPELAIAIEKPTICPGNACA